MGPWKGTVRLTVTVVGSMGFMGGRRQPKGGIQERKSPEKEYW